MRRVRVAVLLALGALNAFGSACDDPASSNATPRAAAGSEETVQLTLEQRQRALPCVQRMDAAR